MNRMNPRRLFDRRKKELVESLNYEILYGQTCSSWLKRLRRAPDEEIQNTLNVLSNEFEDFSKRECQENETYLKYSAIETVSKRCGQAHVYMIQKRYQEALIVIAEAYKLIQYCTNKKYVSQDYEDGLYYFVRGLEISCVVESDSGEKGTQNRLTLLTLEKFLFDLSAFNDLSALSQVGVFALKHYVIVSMKCMSSVLDEELKENLLKMILLDPSNYEWHFCLYMLFRNIRKSMKFLCPSKQEKKALQDALSCEGAKLDPRILVNQILCLAETLRYRRFGVISRPLLFGDIAFYSTGEVVSFLRFKADEILSIDPISVRSNITISKIFSSILDLEFQDSNFACACIERALVFHPNSSKANHAMAAFVLVNSAYKDLPKALNYAKRSYEADKRNVLAYALINFISLHLELKGAGVTFEDVRMLSPAFFENFPLTHSVILFSKAVYLFVLVGLSETVVDLIVQAYISDKATIKYFNNFQCFAKHYNWHLLAYFGGKSILEEIQLLLFHAYKACADASRKEKLFKLQRAALAGVSEEKNRGWRRFPGNEDLKHGKENEEREYERCDGYGNYSDRCRCRKNADTSWEYTGRHYYKNEGGWRSGAGSGYSSHHTNARTNTGIRSMQGPYAVLGISKTASRTEIKKAYLKLAVENHPDKNSHLSETEQLKKQEEMKIINIAWEALKSVCDHHL